MTTNIMRIENRDIVTDDIPQTVIEHFPDIIHSVDPDGRIVFTNGQAEKLLGYTRDELLNMNIRDLYADEILGALEKGFKALKQDGDTTVESVLKDKHGNRIPVEIRSFSIYDGEGQFIRTFSILRDIRQVKDLQQSLIHSERLAAIGELASGIVHDVNNPLSVISMCNQMMQDTLKDRSRLTERDLDTIESFAGDVERATTSIYKLVLHLRNFARGVKEPLMELDLYDSIQDALFLVGSKVTKAKVVVEMDVEKGRHMCRASVNQIEQVFANLFSNACDAMTGCEVRKLKVKIDACVRDATPYWRCSVADTGEGISEEHQREIFDSFFTTKERGAGTGLGLSIVRGIVKEHHGEVEVMSADGEGTTFTVYLPQIDRRSIGLQGGEGLSLIA
jgi:PAS domain S-box-containing protein